MEAIGFKEWQIVCDALASGRQAIILRKGGIHEGRQGFSFAHESFFLFPTRFHVQGQHVREGETRAMPEWQPGDRVIITHHAQALRAVTLTDWSEVSALFPFHIYSEQTVHERFDWVAKGIAASSIHVAFVRVMKLPQPWEFIYRKSHGGCRSWVNIPAPPAAWLENSTPVLDEVIFNKLTASLPR